MDRPLASIAYEAGVWITLAKRLSQRGTSGGVMTFDLLNQEFQCLAHPLPCLSSARNTVANGGANDHASDVHLHGRNMHLRLRRSQRTAGNLPPEEITAALAAWQEWEAGQRTTQR